jgi:oligoribonuclease (3'-5' exoribonuclease)
MGEVFIVQKRPAHGVSNGFYYRIVDIRTGKAVNQNFSQAVQAETHCRHLNEVLGRPTTADSSGVNQLPDW